MQPTHTLTSAELARTQGRKQRPPGRTCSFLTQTQKTRQVTRLISSNPLKASLFLACHYARCLQACTRENPAARVLQAWLVEAQWPPRSAHTRFVAMPHRRWGARTPRHAHHRETQNTWLANASSCGSVNESADGSSASSISAVFMRSAASTARPQPMTCSFHTAFAGRSGRRRAARDLPLMGSAVSTARPQPMTHSLSIASKLSTSEHSAVLMRPAASTARPLRRG